MKQYILLLLSGLFLAGCSSIENLYDVPIELQNRETTHQYIIDSAPFISKLKYFIDPGHGGEDRKNKGSRGTVEADVNLRVALYLKDFLQQAGAVVLMSRVTDKTVGLKDRSLMANESGADIFISIHHNAPPKAGDDYTNYTSVYYHAKPDDYEFDACEHDLAKYIERDLAYAMRNSGGPGSFDGTYSDYNIYPGEGFSVLRETLIPSVLIECGFHTHHLEEQLLAVDEFNKIEAWGIFKGLTRYLKSGIPLIQPLYNDTLSAGDINLNYSLTDSSGIDSASISVQFDSVKTLNYTFSKQTNILSINLQNVETGFHNIKITAANKNGSHNFPFRNKILVTE